MLLGEAGNDRPLTPPWGPTLGRSCKEFGEDGIPGRDRDRINAPHSYFDAVAGCKIIPNTARLDTAAPHVSTHPLITG
jgi:hypothetical protein